MTLRRSRNDGGGSTASRRSVWRIGWPRTDKDRAAAMISSLFLHIHPARVSRHVLRPTYTLGARPHLRDPLRRPVVTGLALMLYYVPYPPEAYRSMKDLQFVVTFGIVLRNMHRWSAHAMVAVVFLHMCRVFWTGSYKPPREFNWVVGVAAAAAHARRCRSPATCCRGTSSRSGRSRSAPTSPPTRRSSASSVKFLLLGGHVIGPMTLLRFYVLHCVILPLAMLMLISLHVWRVRKDGLSGAEAHGDARSRRRPASFPASTKTYGLMALTPAAARVGRGARSRTTKCSPGRTCCTASCSSRSASSSSLHVVSLVFMAPLEEMADPTRTPNPAKAPWYFLGLQELVHYSALVGGVIVPDALVVVALLVLPYLDRGTRAASGRWFAPERRVANTIFTALVIVFVGADHHRHAVPRPELGLGLAVESEADPSARRGSTSPSPCLGLAFLPIFSWVLFHEETAEWRDDAGALRAARGDGQEPASARRRRPASAACARSGCPTSGRVDRCDDVPPRHRRSRVRERAAAVPDASRHVADDAPGRSLRLHVVPRRPGPGDRLPQRRASAAARSCARPMRPLETIEANCGTCHRSLDPPDAPRLAEGRRLIVESGCVSCHEIPGLRGRDVPRAGARQPRLQGAARVAASAG